jgi:hypothetical protein
VPLRSGTGKEKKNYSGVNTREAQRAPDRVIPDDLFQASPAHLLAVSGSSTPGFEDLLMCQIERSVSLLQER